MKVMFILLAIALNTGCGAIDRFGAYLTGQGSDACTDEGVKVYQYTSGAVVAIDKAGMPVGCD